VLAYRLRARNFATSSENKIHDDAVARTYGFTGGLVPGVTVFAYMTRPVAERWGRPWLEGGSMSARFAKPFYDGQELTVTGRVRETAPVGVAELAAVNSVGDECASGEARQVRTMSAPPLLEDYPAVALPEERPPAGPGTLAPGTVLGSLVSRYDADRGRAFLEQIGDDLPLYDGGRLAHPGYLLLAANAVLVANVRLGPWVHVSSEMSHFAVVHAGDSVSTRARVRQLFERRGHEFVELDVLFIAGADRAVAHVRHTAIYRLRPIPPEKSV
jgi:acyl dehydratase